jgi:hypothetical protein
MLTGERRALSAAVFAFYAFLYLIVASAPPMPGWATCFGALAAVYGIGFFGLVAGYFWARWFSIGLGISGLISAAVALWQIGPENVILFYGGTHLGVALALWGTSMASSFDGRLEWRERFHLDENATHKLGKAVIRAGVSLPYVIMYALAPKEDMGGMLVAAGAGLLTAAGVWALCRMRTWGVVALGAGIAGLLASLSSAPGFVPLTSRYEINVALLGVAAVLAVAAAVAPFVKPVVSYLRTR